MDWLLAVSVPRAIRVATTRSRGVAGDPSRDIRLLQDKSAIRAIFKAGVAVDLAARGPIERWPWESASELTYDGVRGAQGRDTNTGGRA